MDLPVPIGPTENKVRLYAFSFAIVLQRRFGHAEDILQVGIHLIYSNGCGQEGTHLQHRILEGNVVAGVALEYVIQDRQKFRERKRNVVKRPAGSQALVPIGGNNGSVFSIVQYPISNDHIGCFLVGTRTV